MVFFHSCLYDLKQLNCTMSTSAFILVIEIREIPCCGGLKFQTLCQQKQGFAFLVELVAPGLLSAGYFSYVVCELLHRNGIFSGFPLS